MVRLPTRSFRRNEYALGLSLLGESVLILIRSNRRLFGEMLLGALLRLLTTVRRTFTVHAQKLQRISTFLFVLPQSRIRFRFGYFVGGVWSFRSPDSSKTSSIIKGNEGAVDCLQEL